MTDFLRETPGLAQRFCPTCESWRDPLTEILIEDYCGAHRPSLAGLDDARVGEAVPLGNSDTDLDTQRGMAALLRSHPVWAVPPTSP